MRPGRIVALLALPLMLAACGGPAEPVWAPDAAVRAAAYHDGPPEIRLYTVVSVRNGSGAHSGLLINAGQRVLFDPAGSFQMKSLPERNDVLYGITDDALKVYIDYHARKDFNVVEERIPVTMEQAMLAQHLAEQYGAVPKAQCSLAITRILHQIPGFETMPVSWFPGKTEHWFGTLPGATRRVITDDDADKNYHARLVPRGFAVSAQPG